MIALTTLAAQIGAQLEGLAQQHEIMLVGVAPLKRARENEVSFYTHRRYRQELATTHAAAVILAAKDKSECKVPKLVMANPYLGYARAATLLNPLPARSPTIHPTAVIHPHATVDATVVIGPHAVIGAEVHLGARVDVGPGCVIEADVTVGVDSRLMANVTLCSGTHIGQRVIIHPGAVIGADGFGLANDAGVWFKIPQLGGVRVEDDVEIGANTTIDKGALEDTVIARGAKLDNQIQIGHNVHIGEHTAIAGCVGIAGSTHIGRHCLIAGGVGIVGHITIVDNVHITGGSIVLQSILEPGLYSSGTPLEFSRSWRRNYHRFKQLDDMAHRLHALEQVIFNNNGGDEEDYVAKNAQSQPTPDVLRGSEK